jgi:large subunit ribosomal protein L6
MSRIGKLPITIPQGVTITVDSSMVNVKGPKGELSLQLLEGITCHLEEDNSLIVKRANDESTLRAKHGLTRALINNMVIGVSQGFSKKLEVNGVGFKVALQGNNLNLSLGFSHDINYQLPTGINAVVEQNTITISGIDKQQVGQVAAEIRKFKKPEPYKGKGIKYSDEVIIRKSGKSGKDK